MIEKKVTFKNNKGQRLAGILHIPKGKGPFPAVILCHGLASNKDTIGKVRQARKLSRVGFIVLRFDFSGHGESEGEFKEVTVGQAIKDLGSVLKIFRKNSKADKNRIGIVGVSFGGPVAEFVVADQLSTKALVLIVPANDFYYKQRKQLGKLGIKQWKKEGYRYFKNYNSILSYDFHLDSRKWIGYRIAPKIKANTLIIHGDRDKEVPITQSKKFFQKLKCNKKFIIIKGGDHHLKRQKLRVVNLVTSWFKKYL